MNDALVFSPVTWNVAETVLLARSPSRLPLSDPCWVISSAVSGWLVKSRDATPPLKGEASANDRACPEGV